MLVPYRVNTLTIRSPWANIAVLALNILMFLAVSSGALSDTLIDRMVIIDWAAPEGFRWVSIFACGAGAFDRQHDPALGVWERAQRGDA